MAGPERPASPAPAWTREHEAALEAMRGPLESLPETLPVPALTGPFDCSLRPPSSKSITNRLLVLAALAEGESVIHRPLADAVDAKVMLAAIERLGAEVKLRDDRVLIRGVAGEPRGGVDLYLENAGTAVRFLTAAGALAGGRVTIDGSARMRERPIAGLVSALRSLRVAARFTGEYGFPPVQLEPGAATLEGGEITLDTQASSQFVSALLMIGPWTRAGVTLHLRGEITSKPYVVMTMELLRRTGAEVESTANMRTIRVGPKPLSAFEMEVEPDASGATYFLAAAALTPGSRCTIEGLPPMSLQPDGRFAELLLTLGADVQRTDDTVTVAAAPEGTPFRGTRFNLAWAPDAAMSLAVAAAFAQGRTVITGLRTLRDKECDRLEATRAELTKLGAAVSIEGDSLVIDGPLPAGSGTVELDTYDDHRMAMALAVAGLRRPGVVIRDPACVSKTYPTFWNDLARLYDAALSRG
jgi:3-phosphoshikimate 1-carboxyvinyltransferase